MPSPKRFLDIEAALRWAYRDELPKRLRGGPTFTDLTRPPPSDFFDDDGATREPGYPAALGEPHPDAIVIEAAVKGLSAWRGHSFAVDDPAWLMHGFVGLAVDHHTPAMEAIAAMAGTVACHARAGTRPGPWRGKPARWMQELPRPFMDTGGNGKPRILRVEIFTQVVGRKGKVRHEPGLEPEPGDIAYSEPVPSPPTRKGIYRVGSYCPLQWRPDPAKVVAERAEWAAWRMGLQLLWQELESRLESIAALQPAAPWRPWTGELEKHGRPPELFKGQRDEPFHRETREQSAMRRRAGLRRELQGRGEETRPFASGKRNLRSVS